MIKNIFKPFKDKWVQIVMITVLGGIFRFWGIFHGLKENFIYHPDTGFMLGDIWRLFLGGDWSKGTYTGPVYNYLLINLIQLIDRITNFLGYGIEWSYESLACVGSLLSALLGTVTIPFVYLTAKKAYNHQVGIWAALFFSICPLHSFHSHYQYRDVPMVFFLVITLYVCFLIIYARSLFFLFYIGLGFLFAIITATIKPAGLLIIIPVILASLVALSQYKKIWLVFPVLFIFLTALLLFSRDSINYRFTNNIGSIMNYFWDGLPKCYEGLKDVLESLKQWNGLLFLITGAIAVGYSVWRRNKSDLIILSFLITAFISTTFIQYFDERFLVFLMPPLTIFIGRLIVETWHVNYKVIISKVMIIIITSIILGVSFQQSIWQGIMFSLPDTRFISNKWLDAHFSKQIRVATEGYYPLGLNEWPNAFFFDISHPVERELKKSDILVTSSSEHMRYFEKPNYYPTQINFFQTLKQKTISLKKFQITNLGFIQPTIEVLLTPSSNSLIVLNKGMGFSDLPRPFDYFWNGGLSFLNKGLLDRDDRTIKLGLSHRYTTTLVSSKTGQEMIVFMQNGPEKSTVKIQLGYTSRIRSLKPGEFHVLKFKPKWFFPKKPALYHFEAGLPEGKNILIQLRCGNREIGEAYTKWGKWEKSLPYLKQALADNANDPEVGLLLAENYEKLNRIADAREVIKEVLTRNPLYSPMLFSLGKANVSITQWENQFQEYTGLNPSLLRYALSQEYTMDKAFPSPSGAGEMKDNCQASGGKVIIYDRAIHKPAEVMHGPYLHLDQGAYLAGFFLRTWEVQGVGPFAEIRVLADDKVISKQSVSVKDLKEDNKQFKEVRIPFINGGPRPEIKFQVFATGKASFAVEKIRLEPDLRKTFQKKWAMLKAVGGENLVGEGRNRGLN